MPVRIKIAETATELDNLFVARHKVFVEEEGYLASRTNGRILDQFDAFPTTANIIALMDNEVVGGIRVTTCSSAGIPSDHFYNFSPFFQDNSGVIAGVSQFFLLKSRRANRYRIAIALMGICAYWAKMKNLTHLVAAVNPVISPLLKLVGMKPVATDFFHRGEGVHVLPMVLGYESNKTTDRIDRKAAGHP
jgi:N-acyl-L-homoserine lactone synthetase